MNSTATIRQNQSKKTAVISFNPHKGQQEIAEACSKYDRVVVRAGRRFGKALALDTPIMTTEGFKTLADVRVGDFVFSELGKPVEVLKKSEVYRNRECYKVQFSDGAEIVADASHDWVVEDKQYRKALGRAKNPLSKPKKLTTEQIAKTYLHDRPDGKVEYQYAIPLTKPLKLAKKKLPIEPYFLGQWLGDGTSSNVGVTTEDIETAQYLESYAKSLGQTVKKKKNTHSNIFSYHIIGGKTQVERNNSLQAKLRQLKVLNNKHIPEIYHLSSVKQRLELLRGLMDSDGYAGRRTNEFCAQSGQLAQDILRLLWSLGIKPTLKEYESKLYGKVCGTKYRVHFNTNQQVFSLPRKQKTQNRPVRQWFRRRYIVGVEKLGSVPVQCLTVDNPTHLFLAGRELIPTHNSSLALNIVLREALKNPGRYWLIAPEYKQAKSIYWRDLVDEYIPEALVVKKNDNELILQIRTAVEGKTSIIEFKGSDNENSLRGAGLKGVILDEFAFQKEHVWDKIISPMLVQTDGWAIFITTPNGVANHFKKFWDNAVANEAKKDNKLWKTFHFTSYDNPLIKEDNLNAERDRLTPEFFEQEYMAEFAKFTGLIYTGFDDKIHVRDFEIEENWSFYRALDFGAVDPDAMPFIGVNKDGVIHIFDEIYISNLYTSELAELIKQKSAHRYFIATYADSAGKQQIMDLGTYGVHCVPVKKNTGERGTSWIVAGINKVQQLLKENKIVVHPRCKGMIKEFMSYSWRKDRLGEAVNMPEDKNNHLLDAFRYFVVSYHGETEETFTNYLNKPVDSVVGY